MSQTKPLTVDGRANRSREIKHWPVLALARRARIMSTAFGLPVISNAATASQRSVGFKWASSRGLRSVPGRVYRSIANADRSPLPKRSARGNQWMAWPGQFPIFGRCYRRLRSCEPVPGVSGWHGFERCVFVGVILHRAIVFSYRDVRTSAHALSSLFPKSLF